jgi:hypothetical protein
MKIGRHFIEVSSTLVIYYCNAAEIGTFPFGSLKNSGFVSQECDLRDTLSRTFGSRYHCSGVITLGQNYVLAISGGTLPDSFKWVHKMKLVRWITSREYTRMNPDKERKPKGGV